MLLFVEDRSRIVGSGPRELQVGFSIPRACGCAFQLHAKGHSKPFETAPIRKDSFCTETFGLEKSERTLSVWDEARLFTEVGGLFCLPLSSGV